MIAYLLEFHSTYPSSPRSRLLDLSFLLDLSRDLDLDLLLLLRSFDRDLFDRFFSRERDLERDRRLRSLDRERLLRFRSRDLQVYKN